MNTDIDERNRKHFKKMEEEMLPRRAVLRGVLAFGLHSVRHSLFSKASGRLCHVNSSAQTSLEGT